jgi:histidine triad (HIT) family protein
MSDTIFTKIIKGELPAHRVYQDDRVLAFMDINPLAEGHVLVIPKEPGASLADLSDDSAAAIGRVLPRICRAIRKSTGCTDFNVLLNDGESAGQAVMHVHFHIIPRYADKGEGAGLTKSWKPTKPDSEALAELGRKIARQL